MLKGMLLILSILTLTAAQAQTTDADTLDAKYATELIKVGKVAPNIVLNTHEGKSFNLKSLRGKYVVLDFWASWCPDCRKEAPTVVKLYNQFKEKNVAFVGVSYDTKAENWKAAIKQYGMTYTHVSELKKMREAKTAKQYGVKWIPSIVVIGPDGKVVLSTVTIEKLERFLEAL